MTEFTRLLDQFTEGLYQEYGENGSISRIFIHPRLFREVTSPNTRLQGLPSVRFYGMNGYIEVKSDPSYIIEEKRQQIRELEEQIKELEQEND